MIPLEMAESAAPIERSDLPALTVDALEGIAERLHATRGVTRIELEFNDGLFQQGWLHERITTARLREFDEDAGAVPKPT